MAEPIHAILGATGHVGGAIASRLLDQKRKVRVVGRDRARLKPFADRGAEVAVASIDDGDALSLALAGAAAAYVLIPPNLPAADFRAYQRKVVEALGAALERARVGHVITLSSIGANRPDQNGPIAGLHEMEQRLGRLSAHVLHLRPGYFMENTLMSIGMVKGMGMNGSAIRADLPMQMIATRDIAEVGARRLAALDWTGKGVLELMGPRDVTLAEVTTALGKAIGRPDLKYVQFPYPDAKKGLMAMGLQEQMADLYVEMSRGFNDGAVRATQPRSPATTTPTTIEVFAETVFAPAFRAS
jgi:uncharacterized protein YbjT (DUF2867 family)